MGGDGKGGGDLAGVRARRQAARRAGEAGVGEVPRVRDAGLARRCAECAGPPRYVLLAYLGSEGTHLPSAESAVCALSVQPTQEAAVGLQDALMAAEEQWELLFVVPLGGWVALPPRSADPGSEPTDATVARLHAQAKEARHLDEAERAARMAREAARP